MTTIMNTISNNKYWNDNIPFDFDDPFSSSPDFIHHDEYDQNFMPITEEFTDLLLSSDNNSQVSPINTSSTEINFSNLVCSVCGAPANGYNFDQITCESCKAFFRRNALRHMPNLKCRFSGSCIINIHTRRQCTYCRLKKCFDINMRKDWIRTEEEKELRQLQKIIKEQSKSNKLKNDQQSFINLPIVMRKKKRLMIKPRNQDIDIKPIYTQIFFDLNYNLSDDDRILLNNITSAHQIGADKADVFRINKYTEPITLIQFINGEKTTHESLIHFYKYIPQFKQLNIDNQISLIKCNLINIILLHYILVENFQESPQIGLYMSNWINNEFHQQMSRTRRYFDRFIEHPLVMKIALIILVFSGNLSTPYGINQSENYINNTNIRNSEEVYTTLLWRYLNNLFGEKEAIRSMELIITQVLRLQLLMSTVEEIFRQQEDYNVFDALIVSLFRLT